MEDKKPVEKKKRNKRGRPAEIITPAFMQKAEKCIVACLSVDGTCRLLGIARSTWYLWKEKSQDPKKKSNRIYVQFFEMVQEALGKAELNLVLSIQNNKDWKAKLSILKRRFANSWDENYIDLLNGKDQEIKKLKEENDRLESEIDQLVG